MQAEALPANPSLKLESLPIGFVEASPAEKDSCQIAGEVSAFVLKQNSRLVELICTSSFSLAAATDDPSQATMVRQIYDAILQNPQALVEQAKAMGVRDIKTLNQLDIGEVATGFSKAEIGIGQTEVMLFRRGDVISSVLVRYEIGYDPIVPLKTVARKLDRQIINYLDQT